MLKYMLSVLIDPAADFASLPKEEQEQSGADVDAVNDALVSLGSGCSQEDWARSSPPRLWTHAARRR